MAKSFPNWMTTIKPQIQEAQWNPVSINMNKTINTKARHNQITEIQWWRENILKEPEK